MSNRIVRLSSSLTRLSNPSQKSLMPVALHLAHSMPALLGRATQFLSRVSLLFSYFLYSIILAIDSDMFTHNMSHSISTIMKQRKYMLMAKGSLSFPSLSTSMQNMTCPIKWSNINHVAFVIVGSKIRYRSHYSLFYGIIINQESDGNVAKEIKCGC